LSNACVTPRPKKRAFSSDESDWVRANRVRHDGPSVLQASIEPLHEPATDEIPIADVLYWLGDVFPIQMPCQRMGSWPFPVSIARPSNRRGLFLYIPLPQYSGLSAKISVIALPRIEGFH
jgi:hypothetical protein